MKKTKNIIARAVLFMFVLTIAAVMIPTAQVKAGSLTSVTDTLTEVWQTQLAASADVAATSISVVDGSGLIATDVLFVTEQGGTGTPGEFRTVSSVDADTIGVDAVEFGWNSASGIDVTVLTGITHSLSFTTATAANVEKIRFTYDSNATTDTGSFNGVAFANLSNITQAGSNVTNQAGYTELNLNDASIAAGTLLSLDITGVRNPNGVTSTSYAVTVETYDLNGTVVDSAVAYFGVDTGVIVRGSVESTLSFTIADDGTANNSSDAVNETISLGVLGTDVLDNATTGYGVDGNLLTVSTNASNGYSISIQDTVFGLVNSSYSGAGRASGEQDNGIDDITATGPWSSAGTESYGYSAAITFNDGDEVYSAFTEAPAILYTQNSPITNDQIYVTVRAQRAARTPAGDYTDQIIYIITPNF